jgi:hypothetical protein
LVIDKIKERVLTTENLNRLVHIVNEEMDGLAIEYRQRLDSVIDEIADVDRRLDRLYDALETGKIQLADLAPRIQSNYGNHKSNCMWHDGNWNSNSLIGAWNWQMRKL